MWRPGKSAESLRAAACLCAESIIKKVTCFDDIILKQVCIYFYLWYCKTNNMSIVLEFSDIFSPCRR